MAQLSPADFVKKWAIRFADNNFQFIREKDFREFAQDIADTFGVTVATVPVYQAGVTYQQGFLVRYTPPGGQEAFYYALNAGALSAPGPSNTTDWKVVPGPTTATALSQSITLLEAQGLDQTSVKAGRTFLIDFGVDGQGNTQTIAVRGVSNDCFDVEGTLEVAGQRWGVEKVDVQAGTFTIRYTHEDIDQQLATKQPALTTYIRTTLYGYTSWNMPATYLGEALAIGSLNDVAITLPTLALSDIPGTLWLLNANGSTSNYTLKILGQNAASSGLVSELVTLKPGESVRLDTARLPQFPPPVGVQDKPVYVVTSYTSLPPASVTPAQLATVATTLPLTATRTADYTLTLADAGCLVPVSSSTAITVTVPAHADVAFQIGTTLYVAQDGPGQVTIAAASGVAVQTADGYKVLGKWQDVALHKRDLNTWVLKGGVS